MTGFRIAGGDLLMIRPDKSVKVIGTWISDDSEQTMRLMARAFREGQHSKVHEIKRVLEIPSGE